jgi:hypothetical protein
LRGRGADKPPLPAGFWAEFEQLFMEMMSAPDYLAWVAPGERPDELVRS